MAKAELTFIHTIDSDNSNCCMISASGIVDINNSN